MNINENIKQVFLVTDTVVCRKCEELGESLFEILLYVSLLIIYCFLAYLLPHSNTVSGVS